MIRENDRLILENADILDLEKTFECGQCFRWTRTRENEYTGVIYERAVRAVCEGNFISFYSNDMDGLDEILSEYFCLDTDYDEIDRLIATDDHMIKCIEYGKGIRILKQDPFETTVSFIISQNNNIPRIRGIIERICERYGEKIEFEGKIYHSFPSPSALCGVSSETFRSLGTGFRDRYLVDAVSRICSGITDLNSISSMPTERARDCLMEIKGIGRKVADCILLFSYARLEICPIDVWMKKIFTRHYDIDEKNMNEAFRLSVDRWGKYAGIAQQYLFYFEREEKNEETADF